MPDLEGLRRRIDALDDRLLEMLHRRAEVVRQVYAVKLRQARGGSVRAFVPVREAEILRRLETRAPGPFPKEGVPRVFREIISACRSLEALPRVACLEGRDSPSHLAALQCFGSFAEFQFQDGLSGAFAALACGRCDFIVVPAGPPAGGMSWSVVGHLEASGEAICREIAVERTVEVYARPGLGAVRGVVAPGPVLAGAGRWLAERFPRAAFMQAASPREALRRAAQHRGGGAAAAVWEGGNPGPAKALPLLVSGAQTSRHFVVGRAPARPSGHDRTSLVLRSPAAGARLDLVLRLFDRGGIAVTVLESLPSAPEAPRRYYLEIQGHAQEPRIERALGALRGGGFSGTVLGAYPSAGGRS